MFKRKFLWSGVNGKEKILWVSWEDVCKPKNNGRFFEEIFSLILYDIFHLKILNARFLEEIFSLIEKTNLIK